MDNWLHTLLWLSLSGTFLALLLMGVRAVAGNKLPRWVQYYLWLAVLLRLIIPVGLTVELPETAPEFLLMPPVQTEVAPTEQMGTLQENELTAQTAQRSLDWVRLAWTAGAVLHFGWFVVSYLRIRRRLLRSCTPYEGEAVLPGRGRLLVHPRLMTPLCIGFLHPIILLPRRELRKEERDYMLRHEWTHFRRGDLWIKWAAVAVTSLHWFNPAMIWIRREIDRACELACDEAVVRSMTSRQRSRYAHVLVDTAADENAPALFMSGMKDVKARVRSVMAYRTPKVGTVILSCIAGIAVLAMAVAAGPVTALKKPVSEPHEQFVTEAEKPDLPLEIPDHPRPLSRAELPDGYAPLEMPAGTENTFLSLYAWRYRAEAAKTDTEWLKTLAEHHGYQPAAGNSYRSVPEETPYGLYQKTLFADAHGLYWYGLWVEEEAVPYGYGEQVKLTAAEAVEMAKTFAEELLQTTGHTQGTPRVTFYPGDVQEVLVHWSLAVDGMPVAGKGLTVELINGQVHRVSLMTAELQRAAAAEPKLLLTAEEALYSVNYARAHSLQDWGVDSQYAELPLLIRAEPALTDLIDAGYETGLYTPAWAFTFANESGTMARTVYVDAYTGRIETDTNEGGFPSPYNGFR